MKAKLLILTGILFVGLLLILVESTKQSVALEVDQHGIQAELDNNNTPPANISSRTLLQTEEDYWLLTGNGDTSHGTNFLGTTDEVTLTLAVSSTTALRLVPNYGTPNLIGGYEGNFAHNGREGITIGGGGKVGGWPNRAYSVFSTVGGGIDNQAGDVNDSCGKATVSGGSSNTAISCNSTIGGGFVNYASGSYSTIPGGYDNNATGSYSFAAGSRAKAYHDGSFVWADSTDVDFASTGPDQFLIEASGGVGIGTNNPRGTLAVTGGGQPIFVDSHNQETGWTNYIGFNTYWNDGNWVSQGDAAHNAGAMIRASWVSGKLVFSSFANSGGEDQIVNPNPDLLIRGNGNVGVNNWNPDQRLHVIGNRVRLEGSTGDIIDLRTDGEAVDLWSETSSIFISSDGESDSDQCSTSFGCNNVIINPFTQNGYVGIGTGTNPPVANLQIVEHKFPDVDAELRITGRGNLLEFETAQDIWAFEEFGPGQLSFMNNGAGRLWFTGETVGVHVLEIHGGSDLAEPFDVNGSVEAGMVVAIDPENPGQLRIADTAYDYMVAGCVSGANGIDPGLILQQEGSEADGEFPVALSGRVYCWADASYGAIQPGDLLTTSDTPGHVMAVSDYDQAQGAIVGKAMSSLPEGQGLVLILVALQ